REASIWRAVTHLGSSAFRPNSPKAIVVPRVAGPLMRGWLCGLRYLTRLGISIGFDLRGSLGGRRDRLALGGDHGGGSRRVLLDHLQELFRALDVELLLEDPNLDADEAGRGEGLGGAVVDIGGVGVQGHSAL